MWLLQLLQLCLIAICLLASDNFSAKLNEGERKLFVYSYGTERGKSSILRSSCNDYNLNCFIDGIGLKWKGFGDTFFAFKKWIESLIESLSNHSMDHVLIMHVDAYDMFFSCNQHEIIQLYYSFNTDIVVGSEIFVWPDQYISQYYPESNTNYTFDFKYLNSGGFIGTLPAINKLISKFIQYITNNDYCDFAGNNCNTFDDQRTLTRIYLEDNMNMKLDYKQQIFTSLSLEHTHIHSHEWCLNAIKVMDNMDIINGLTNQKTCVIHGNGGINAKLYWKMAWVKIKYNYHISYQQCYELLKNKELYDMLGVDVTHNTKLVQYWYNANIVNIANIANIASKFDEAEYYFNLGLFSEAELAINDAISNYKKNIFYNKYDLLLLLAEIRIELALYSDDIIIEICMNAFMSEYNIYISLKPIYLLVEYLRVKQEYINAYYYGLLGLYIVNNYDGVSFPMFTDKYYIKLMDELLITAYFYGDYKLSLEFVNIIINYFKDISDYKYRYSLKDIKRILDNKKEILHVADDENEREKYNIYYHYDVNYFTRMEQYYRNDYDDAHELDKMCNVYVINLESQKDRKYDTKKLLQSINLLNITTFINGIDKSIFENNRDEWLLHNNYNVDKNWYNNNNNNSLELLSYKWYNKNVTNGEIGCGLSHIKTWKYAYYNNIKNKNNKSCFIILEDDNELAIDINNNMDNIKNWILIYIKYLEIRRQYLGNWDIINIGRAGCTKFKDEKYIGLYLTKYQYSFCTNAYILSISGIKKLINISHFYEKNLVALDELFGAILDPSSTRIKHLKNDYKNFKKLNGFALMDNHDLFKQIDKSILGSDTQ